MKALDSSPEADPYRCRQIDFLEWNAEFIDSEFCVVHLVKVYFQYQMSSFWVEQHWEKSFYPKKKLESHLEQTVENGTIQLTSCLYYY